MTSRLIALAWDANEPQRLAEFWVAALGWSIADDADDEVVELHATDGTQLQIDFVRVPEPRSQRSRIHLDLTTSSPEDQQQTVERLIGLGARHFDVGQGPDELHVVLADPEGNEFCVIEPQNNFLAGCGRLGSITCDGPREVGVFWSETLGWPLVWDQDGETAIHAQAGTKFFVTWGGPSEPKAHKNRLHLDIAPPAGVDQAAEVARLEGLGARRIDIGQGDVSWIVMADPDGNEFCVLTPR